MTDIQPQYEHDRTFRRWVESLKREFSERFTPEAVELRKKLLQLNPNPYRPNQPKGVD